MAVNFAVKILLVRCCVLACPGGFIVFLWVGNLVVLLLLYFLHLFLSSSVWSPVLCE